MASIGSEFQADHARVDLDQGVVASAQGVLMAWCGTTREEAFAILRRTADGDGRSLAEVAGEVLASTRAPGSNRLDGASPASVPEPAGAVQAAQAAEEADGAGASASRAGPATVEDVRLVERLSRAVPKLLAASSHLEPDGLAAAVAESAMAAGLEEAVIFLVDHEQLVLTPLDTDSTHASLEVEGTLAGRAFQGERPVTVARDDGRWQAWVPLLDGAERVGVLQVCLPFLSDDVLDRLLEFAGAVAELIVAKTQYGDGLILARRRAQMSLSAELRWPVLPPLTFASERVGVACVLEPAYDVAGDAFDYAMNSDVLSFAIFDAMGHGLEATQMANLALGAYRYSRRRRMGLSATFIQIDEAVADGFGTDRFVTGQLVTLDCRTGTLTWLSAGHPLPVLLRRGGAASELMAEPSIPMGLGFEPEPEAQVSLEPGDHLLFFTDGVVEAKSPGGERFGQRRLVDLAVRALADQQTLAETARRLVRSVRLHRHGPLQDDATLLLASWDPRPGLI